ncbi:cupin-like domain-containing protein [Qipengyuania atrilutea]|uniref:cupin-like domain-containing protein n=1 Tax=Qipengyuania atrilutea TaxID=2744473 RepID=UPI001CECAE74|nr:cupin-like domain-containing protein [Actirhodobacter atriluteus]
MHSVPETRAVAVSEEPLPQGAALDTFVEERGEPVVFKGAGTDLPIVRHARDSSAAVMNYLRAKSSGRPLTVYRADPEQNGRFHYAQALDGFNFRASKEPLDPLLAEIAGDSDETIYVGSTDLELFFPGLWAENDPGLEGVVGPDCAPVVGSLWMGNRTVTAAHYDLSNNCAVCAAGCRRFTLFPPDQIGNLYPGPLEPTPGGQVVSMVDFSAPDFARYPRFAEALQTAQSVVLEPGDILVYPAMWWHQVEGLDAFNILVNWWWNAVPEYVDTPQITLMHALLSIRQRPAHERAAWKAVFDHYVFGDGEDAAGHLQEHVLGPLGEIDPMLARRLRAVVTRRIQR